MCSNDVGVEAFDVTLPLILAMAGVVVFVMRETGFKLKSIGKTIGWREFKNWKEAGLQASKDLDSSDGGSSCVRDERNGIQNEKAKRISYWIQAATKNATREQPPKTHLPKPSLKHLKEFRPDLHEFNKKHCIHRFL
ncbi:hypothetical protein L2E82_01362 [Cichorium intybus]|uniref:Uncharacterized protein n=1 Tax=Cichorium intybus TaxID=13427 RepID=A0ACB9GZY1_CICIN|nr:hypothetical protein L2E82_01362 [Cichorium intybus]